MSLIELGVALKPFFSFVGGNTLKAFAAIKIHLYVYKQPCFFQ